MSQDIASLRNADLKTYKKISTGFLYPADERLQSEYFRLFGPDALCPLEITNYLSCNEFMQARLIADISGFYRAFGLSLKDNMRQDNLSVCFEFMSYLCLKQIYCINKGYDEKLRITESAFHSFLNEFIKPALPKFLSLIRQHSKSRFYKELADLAEDSINI